MPSPPVTVAEIVARFVAARAADRVFGLQGGHIQPIWDQLVRLGVPVIDARDERAAVHMAHAYGELTGRLGVALVTAGPGVTNAVTGVANAHAARAPLLVIGGAPPRPQDGLGALQALPHVALMRPITRFAETARVPEQVPRLLDRACAAAAGEGGAPGPAFVEVPTDVLRAAVPDAMVLAEHFAARAPRRRAPDAGLAADAAQLVWAARRPLVISGRGARGAGRALVRLLDASGAVHLDTQDCRGVVADDHPASVGAVRARAMAEADLVLLAGRRLDYQLGYGSPAVLPNATLVRVSDLVEELADNRRGAVELHADVAAGLDAITDAAGNAVPAADRTWTKALRAEHEARRASLAETMASAPAGEDGFMHPYRLIGAVNAALDAEAVVAVDGGDILSFARIALRDCRYLDPGPLGCLGVGVPFAVAAALACPGRKVVALTGDGAFGFNALELDTAARHGARAVFIVANNGAWNIEAYDQKVNWSGRLNGSLLRRSDYAGLARALGLHAERIEDPDALPAALARAFADAPALLDVQVTRDAVSPDGRSGLAAVPDLQPLATWDAAERARRGS